MTNLHTNCQPSDEIYVTGPTKRFTALFNSEGKVQVIISLGCKLTQLDTELAG